jgi:hypothetical protein
MGLMGILAEDLFDCELFSGFDVATKPYKTESTTS